MIQLLQNKLVRRLLVYPLLMVAAGYVWFQYKFPTCTFRYKMTAEVMTPEGLKTGSSVIEVSYSHNADYGGGQSSDLNMTGEAVYVDLGQGKNLFVSLTADYSVRRQSFRGRGHHTTFNGALNGFEIPLRVFGLDWPFDRERELCAAIDQIPEGRIYPVALMNLPALLTFSDLTNPDAFMVVEPADFEKIFGVRFKLQGANVVLTSAPPTQTEMKIFPWWADKMEERKRAGFTGLGQSLIINLMDNALKRPGIFDSNW